MQDDASVKVRSGGPVIAAQRLRSGTIALLLSATAASAPSFGCAPAARSASVSDSVAVAALEQRSGACMMAQDAACLDSILAPDWSVRWADGSRQSRVEYLASVTRQKDSYTTMTTDSLTLRMFGTAAVITGIDTEQSSFSGRDGSGRYAWLDVFAKRGGRWQLVVSQSTRLP